MNTNDVAGCLGTLILLIILWRISNYERVSSHRNGPWPAEHLMVYKLLPYTLGQSGPEPGFWTGMASDKLWNLSPSLCPPLVKTAFRIVETIKWDVANRVQSRCWIDVSILLLAYNNPITHSGDWQEIQSTWVHAYLCGCMRESMHACLVGVFRELALAVRQAPYNACWYVPARVWLYRGPQIVGKPLTETKSI